MDNMKTKNLILICSIILIIFFSSLIYLTSLNSNEESIIINDQSSFNVKELGSNYNGNVQLIGPIGNENSDVKIAYIIGVHPTEQMVHNSLYNNLIEKSDSLNYCYYIYKINVSSDRYDNGREAGQLLGNEFVVPHVISNDYDLVIDVHSNEGTVGGNYLETNFIFVPVSDAQSQGYVDEIISKSPHLTHYFPESQTSPPFVTIPIIESGTSAMIYETYKFEDESVTNDYIIKLILAIEKLNL